MTNNDSGEARNSPFLLHVISVVVTAEFHNPSILSHDFLVSEGIVPNDWKPSEAIATPPLSIVHYANGIHWMLDQSRLTINEEALTPFKEKYLVHEMAQRYLRKLPHTPYRSLGLNCVASVKIESPVSWLTDRFLPSQIRLEVEPKVVGLEPKFTLDADDVTVNIEFKAGQAKQVDGSQEDSVIIDCNVHHDGPLNVSDQCEAIERWSDRQSLIVMALEKLLKHRQT